MQRSTFVTKSVTRSLLKRNDLANTMKINFCPFYILQSRRYYRRQKTETPLAENLCEGLTMSVNNLSAADSF